MHMNVDEAMLDMLFNIIKASKTCRYSPGRFIENDQYIASNESDRTFPHGFPYGFPYGISVRSVRIRTEWKSWFIYTFYEGNSRL